MRLVADVTRLQNRVAPEFSLNSDIVIDRVRRAQRRIETGDGSVTEGLVADVKNAGITSAGKGKV